jgi:nucleotide-binding universal stress UspA family protein
VKSPEKTIAMHRILCPTDFSPASEHAFEHAVALATWYEAALTILHVTSNTIVPFSEVAYIGNPMLMDPVVLDQTMSQLAALAAPARKIGLRTDTEVREGKPAAEILDVARDLPADLVVMGTHGRRDFERFVLGSVTETVLRRVSCPVLTVPVHAPAHPQPMFFKRILCATDFSPASEAAVRYAASLAEEADGVLILVHVLDRERAARRPPGANGHEPDFECAARMMLRAALPRERREWCSVDEVVVSGKPAPEILRLAQEREAGLIVMGVHGRGILDLMAFGSVTHEVVREGTCPVLTVRSPTR